MVDERQGKVLKIVMAAILLAAMYFVAREGAAYVASGGVITENKQKACVVIDAGHGGADPGKVGIDGSLEKDINLQIAEKLKALLESQDVEVVMTRTDEKGLYDENASGKKVQDMKRRIAMIEEARPELVVSIHQNSYQGESIHGAQVFYFTHSQEGEKAAKIIQEALLEADSENTRSAKANDTYYMLKKTEVPVVIVECGFLSNQKEADLLVTEEYQQKVAEAVVNGIIKYISGEK